MIVQSTIVAGAAGVGLTKAGAGTLELTAVNPYTGPTTINGGTLVVNGTQPDSPVVVNSSGTLAGARSPLGIGGEVGPLTVNSGGTVSPGAAPGGAGILTVNGNAVFRAGSTLRIDLNGTSPGTGHDQLNVIGRVALADANLEGRLGFSSAVGDRFAIIANDAADDVDGTLLQGDSVTIGGQRFSIDYAGDTGNDVVLRHENTSPTFVNRSITSPLTEGQTATLTGTIVDPDPLDTFFLDVNWGDGIVRTFAFGPGANGTTVNVTHTYEDEDDDDTYVIHLVWRDEHAISNSADLEVTVHNVDPVVDAGGLALVRNRQPFTRRGFFTDPGLLDTHTATVDYGDGAGPEPLDLRRDGSFRLRHRYTRPGVYRVTVAVTDDDGGVGRDRFRVVVLPSGRGALVQQLVDLFFALTGGSDDDPFDGGR